MYAGYRYSGIGVLKKAIAQSYATAMVTLKEDEDGRPPFKPYHDVTVFNKNTRQPVAVPALSDQGNDVTLFTEDWAPRLGYDLSNPNEGTQLGVTGVGGSMAKHFVAVEGIMQIAPNLKPVRTTFAFGDTPKNLLGRESILGRYNVLYTPTSVQYTETSSGFDNRNEAMATMARYGSNARNYTDRRIGADWRNRV